MKNIIPISENQLQELKEMFHPTKRYFSTFQDCRIVVEEAGDYFDYEIFRQDPVYFKWHVWHSDTDFESRGKARKAAEKYIKNCEPSDDYYAQ